MTSSLRSNAGSLAPTDELARRAPASKPKAITVSARFMNRSPLWRTSYDTCRRGQHNRQPAGRRRAPKQRNGIDGALAADCSWASDSGDIRTAPCYNRGPSHIDRVFQWRGAMTEQSSRGPKETSLIAGGPAAGAAEEVEVKGHIVDSLLLPKILDRILLMGGRFEIKECKIGV